MFPFLKGRSLSLCLDIVEKKQSFKHSVIPPKDPRGIKKELEDGEGTRGKHLLGL